MRLSKSKQTETVNYDGKETKLYPVCRSCIDRRVALGAAWGTVTYMKRMFSRGVISSHSSREMNWT